MFAARNVLLAGYHPPAAPPVFDAIGSGSSGLSLAAFNFAAALGADVFVDAVSDRNGGTVTGASYGGVAMTLVNSVNNANNATYGHFYRFRLAGAGTGAAKSVAFTTSGSAWYLANAISVRGVHSVGSLQAAYGAGTSLSQGSIAATASQLILQTFASGNGGGGAYAFSSPTGGANHWNANNTGCNLLMNTASGLPTTFGAHCSGTDYWAGMAHVLS